MDVELLEAQVAAEMAPEVGKILDGESPRAKHITKRLERLVEMLGRAALVLPSVMVGLGSECFVNGMVGYAGRLGRAQKYWEKEAFEEPNAKNIQRKTRIGQWNEEAAAISVEAVQLRVRARLLLEETWDLLPKRYRRTPLEAAAVLSLWRLLEKWSDFRDGRGENERADH